MKRVAVERKNCLEPTAFSRHHLRNGGIPVVVTDGMDNWPARSKWTFEHFKAVYGQDLGAAPCSMSGGAKRITKLSAYIDFLDASKDTPLGALPGLWMDGKGRHMSDAPKLGASPPWYFVWHAFRHHPELYDDIKPTPYFTSDLVLELDPTLRRLIELTSGIEYWEIYLGAANSLTPLHQDYWGTHGYLAQIQGRKRVELFAPSDSEYLYQGQVDPEKPNPESHPLFEKATAYECEIGPGEILYIPPGWWHHIRGLEKSITVSHNYFNETNFSQHLTHILQKLPELVRNLEQSPRYKEELGIGWQLTDIEEKLQ